MKKIKPTGKNRFLLSDRVHIRITLVIHDLQLLKIHNSRVRERRYDGLYVLSEQRINFHKVCNDSHTHARVQETRA